MTRHERLMATLRGEPVDRPPVSFYEIDGDQRTDDDDPFNIFSHPSWHPLIQLARDKTDRIVRRGASLKDIVPDPLNRLGETETFIEGRSRITVRTLEVAGRTLTRRMRRDPDVDTVWEIEHPLKDIDDLKALLELPPVDAHGEVDAASIVALEAELGDAGIIMFDLADPLCFAASLFDMATYTIIALTERKLFHRLIQRFQEYVQPVAEKIAEAAPGRLWRIVGPEYASVPYLPPALFREYATEYDKPIVDAIHAHGGFARLHCHGNIKDDLDNIVATGCMAIDPIEPEPQGDVTMAYVRERYGDRLVLFGNLEASDLETLPTEQFAEKIRTALDEGTAGHGRGMVLMPSASPYGRVLSPRAMANYKKIVELVEAF